MTTLPAWADVREAMRLDGGFRRQTLARERRRAATEKFERRWRWMRAAWAVVKWGFPAVFPLWASIDERAAVSFGLIFLALAASWHGRRAVTLDVLLALRMPSRSAWTTGRLAAAVPYLAWCALHVAAAALGRPSEHGLVGVAAAVGCFLLAPFQMLRSASKHAREGLTSHQNAIWGCLAGLVVFVAIAVAFDRAGRTWHGRSGLGLVVLYALLFGDARRDRFVVGVPRVAADTLWGCLLLTLTVSKVTLPTGWSPELVLAGAAYVVVWPFVASVLLVRETLRDVELMEVAKKESRDSSDKAPKWTVDPSRPAPHRHPGRGLWRASWEWWFRMETPGPLRRDGTWLSRLGDFGITVLSWLVQLFRAGIGPALAFSAAALPTRIESVGAALAAAAALAARTFVARPLEKRMYLFGVDYVDQVRHELRALVLVAGLPIVAAALAGAAWRGFTLPATFGVVAVVSMLLFRIGWPGLSGETNRIFGCLVWAGAVIVGIFVPSTGWTGLAFVAGALVLGALGVARRFAGLDETRLRAAMADEDDSDD